MKIKGTDFETLFSIRDTSEEALTSKMFHNDIEYLRIVNEADEEISLRKIEIITI